MEENIAFGRYNLLERLAAGSVADIYRAITRTADGRDLTVVVKRIRDELAKDSEFAAMFIDEAKIASALDHPNVAKVYEWNRHDGALFIAMEYIEGTNLASVMQSCSEQALRFPPALAIYVLAEVLAGLGYAHNLKDAYGHPLGIVHRGLSPQNILLSSAGQVKLVDFGMARATSRAAATRPGVFTGLQTYLAPEVARHTSTDGRADLFSLGVVLYELLTGQKLHAGSGTGVQAVCQALRRRLPSSVHSDIPAELDRLVIRSVAEDPHERYSSAAALREELMAFLQRWDSQVDAAALSSFLIEAFSGSSADENRGGFAFGEATSHWFATGDELLRMDPQSEPVEAARFEPTAEAEGERTAPTGGFAAGSTVMAVEAGGLGKRRHWKSVVVVAVGVAAVVALVFLVATSLGHKTDPAQTAAAEEGFAGPVQVKTQPQDALIFVDGNPVRPVGNPPRLLNLRAGKRRFRLVQPGYLPWEGDVQLREGQPEVIEQKLVERVGKLTIRSKPSRALVFLDGKRIGRTPRTIADLSAAEVHRLVLRARRRAPLKLEIRPTDWPDDPRAELVIEKELVRPSKGRKGRRNRSAPRDRRGR